MRITYTLDHGRVTLLLELGCDVDPDRAADSAWAAVYQALAEHRAAGGAPPEPGAGDAGPPDAPVPVGRQARTSAADVPSWSTAELDRSRGPEQQLPARA